MKLKELSRILGLSQTTVSRALNGYPEVSEATRRRVSEAAKAFGYHPNPRAQSLATGQSRCIGHVLSVNDSGQFVNPIFGDFMAGAGETYAKHGYDIILTRVDGEAEADAYRNLHARGAVDGVVLHSPRANDPRIPILQDIGLPFVVHGRATGTTSAYDWLDVNNRGAFAALTDKLLQNGHRRIALINGAADLDFAIRRRSGFELAMAKARVPIDFGLVVNGELSEEHGFANAKRMLAARNPPTAFLVASLICALGVRRAIEESGLRVARDVSIAIFDDCLSYLPNGGETPIFTAARSSVRKAGEVLADMLLNRIQNPDAPAAHTLWEAALVDGSSIGSCPAA